MHHTKRNMTSDEAYAARIRGQDAATALFSSFMPTEADKARLQKARENRTPKFGLMPEISVVGRHSILNSEGHAFAVFHGHRTPKTRQQLTYTKPMFRQVRIKSGKTYPYIGAKETTRGATRVEANRRFMERISRGVYAYNTGAA